MTKREFLRRLRRELDCKDKDDVIAYYNELIEDKMDRTGMTEEEVIDELDSVEAIVRKTNRAKHSSDKIIYDEVPNKKFKKKKSSGNLLFKILYFPVWFVVAIVTTAIGIAAFALGLSLGCAAVGSIIFGVANLRGSLSQGAVMICVGAIGLGFTLILVPLFYKVLSGIFKCVKNIYKKIIQILTGGAFCEN